MNELLDKQIIISIANELGVLPSYIEKDYWATFVLIKVADFNVLGRTIIFTGGTSLSKGYNLIQRFSEDLDFEIDASEHLTEGQRRQIRHSFVELIQSIPEIEIVKTFAENEGHKQTLLLKYPHQFEIAGHLRDNLKVELFLAPSTITTEKRPIRSFITAYTSPQMVDAEILCNHPKNIMADKFNAITWRIFDAGEDFDYTVMRHLHDLCAIKKRFFEEVQFKKRVLENFEKKDKARVPGISFKILVVETNQKLLNDKKYHQGYERFVDSMSYATEAENISFEDALACYQELSRLF
ncbi:MAG: nucleotidyl transferase AbiEii/AbiGii toxin family protein [Alphaproteobacteria bacterium]